MDIRPMVGRYATDIRRTYGGHMADMRQICGGYAADMGQGPVRLADICHFDVSLSFSFHCIRHDNSLGGRGFPNNDA